MAKNIRNRINQLRQQVENCMISLVKNQKKFSKSLSVKYAKKVIHYDGQIVKHSKKIKMYENILEKMEDNNV